jgi:sphingomyelin phosphodiesterase
MRNQLQWLHDTLLKAEQNNETVHMLNHMHNGHEDVYQPCSREYRRIMDRFSHIVVAEFHGHSEYFDVNVIYRANNPSEPTSIAFSGGSVASFIEVNRNYMIYTVDPVSYVSMLKTCI